MSQKKLLLPRHRSSPEDSAQFWLKAFALLHGDRVPLTPESLKRVHLLLIVKVCPSSFHSGHHTVWIKFFSVFPMNYFWTIQERECSHNLSMPIAVVTFINKHW